MPGPICALIWCGTPSLRDLDSKSLEDLVVKDVLAQREMEKRRSSLV